MSTTTNPPVRDVDDVGEALREGRPLCAARAYRILYAQDNLEFRPVTVADPVPLGRQILAAAGAEPRDDYSLFAILQTGEFEDVRLDEQFDLRGHGAERFIAFRTDRVYKLLLNDRQIAWGQPTIPGSVLYALASPAPGEAVFLDIRGGTDRLIEPGEAVNLNEPGVERFITAAKPVTEYEIIVNSRPYTVREKRVTFEQVVQMAFPGTADPNAAFSMTYQHADSNPHAGELAAGGSVEVKKKGTVFNVTKTIRS